MKTRNEKAALEEARAKVAAWSLDELLGYREEVLEPQWKNLQDKEAGLIAAIKDEFRKAGATEVQLAWNRVENVRVGLKGQLRLAKLFKARDQLNWEALPWMCLAAACNERIAELAE